MVGVRSVATAVVRHKIVEYDLNICLRDFGIKHVDHLVHLSFPTLTVDKRRVHGQIIERVAASATMGFNGNIGGLSLGGLCADAV